MSNITLGTATAQNLLSLQNIDSQLDTTQNALSTGLKVSSAVDNAVTYFEAQSLDNRANDLSTRKDNIDQGVQSLTTATQGIQSAIAVMQQMQGILQSAKTETASERASAATQFNTLAVQLNQLLNDSSYQGLNLVNSKTTNLTLQFSVASASTLKVSGTNLLFSSWLTKQGVVTYAGAASAGSGHTAGSGYSRTHSTGSGISNQVLGGTFKASVGATAMSGVKFSTAV